MKNVFLCVLVCLFRNCWNGLCVVLSSGMIWLMFVLELLSCMCVCCMVFMLIGVIMKYDMIIVMLLSIMLGGICCMFNVLCSRLSMIMILVYDVIIMVVNGSSVMVIVVMMSEVNLMFCMVCVYGGDL